MFSKVSKRTPPNLGSIDYFYASEKSSETLLIDYKILLGFQQASEYAVQTYEMKKLLILSPLMPFGIFLYIYTKGAVCCTQGMSISTSYFVSAE